MRQMILRSACLVVLGQVCAAAEYAIVVSEATRNDPAWAEVVASLSARHAGAEVVPYRHHVAEAQPTLAKLHPRSTCFVATLDESGRDFVADVHRLTRSYDDDPWTDTLWGILTGFDAANALAIAKYDTPLTVRKVASGTDVALDACTEGLWYDELVRSKTVAKAPGGKPVQSEGPADTTRALADTLEEYRADLFVTSGHATERDWQIGFSYRNGSFQSKAGRLYGVPTNGERFEISSTNPKAYLPIGNCLMGHIDGPDAMALAWMNSCGVKQMAGYTVPTWYGYAGWGLLDYFVEQPGRYTLAEAFLANQLALQHRLYAAVPDAATLTPQPGQMARIPRVAEAGKALGVSTQDAAGLLHDRDVVAFYGDPAWEASMAAMPEALAYDQVLTHADGVYTLTITPRRGVDSFKPVNTNGSQRGWRPMIARLPNRATDVKLLAGSELNPLIADDFVLVPNPRECDPEKKYVVSFRGQPLP